MDLLRLWIYGVLLAYCLGKKGCVRLGEGALGWRMGLYGEFGGGGFALGRFASPWICSTFTTTAPWIALASAGVERYSLRVLLTYRFVKGSFSLVGLGAGASLLSWRKFLLIDGEALCGWKIVVGGALECWVQRLTPSGPPMLA
ncbi:hypothetical protein [Rhodoferax sp.]|uniref:hypothetical protein n=1 Tax=Rhodoferax sp. TaxID=50421 RepID=UPI002ACD759E|nr:hypothetical protein [Rhodoferax sp.]MDZ7919202.1 hypothetical protein [Rhodoferax sp.]